MVSPAGKKQTDVAQMNSIPELLDDIRAGRMVVVLDDEDRENEGDLIMAASQVRPEDINFMARYARGLICLPLTRERCRQLSLPLMVSDNGARYATNFTVSIEAAEGVTTGISAYDRAHTIRTAVRPDARPDDVTQPGHVFPLMAQPGGVLTRAGHTEAGVDMVRLAGLEPAAVLVEILNEDGSMARRPQLEQFAAAHDLKIGTIADLIRYRLATEMTVSRCAQRRVETVYGTFELYVYRDTIERQSHYVLVHGDVSADPAPLVRVHLQNPLSDLLQVEDEALGLPLRVALNMIADSPSGVVIVLGGLPDDDVLISQVKDDSDTAGTRRKGDSQGAEDLRTYGIGAQILADLGVNKMRVISAPKKFHGLSGFGLEVVEYIEPADSLLTATREK